MTSEKANFLSLAAIQGGSVALVMENQEQSWV